MPVIVQTRSLPSLLVFDASDAHTDSAGALFVVDAETGKRFVSVFSPGEWLSAYVAEDFEAAVETATALGALLRTMPLGPSEPAPETQLDHAPLLPFGTAVYALDVLSDLTMPAWKDFLVGKTERPKDPLPYCDLEDDHWWRPLGPRPDGFGMEPFVWRASRANLVGYAERTAPAKGDLVLIGAGATLAVGEVGTQVWHDNRARLGHVVEPEDDEGDVLVNTEDGERYVAARFVQVIDPFDAL